MGYRPDFQMPQPGEGWRHYKGGFLSLCQIVRVGLHTETGEPVVIYRDYSDEHGTYYVRPLNVFLASVEHDGRRRSRFKYERSPSPMTTAF